MNKILALVAITGLLVGAIGCGPKDAGPAQKAVEAPKPDLGDPGSATQMHDESKGKSTVTTPEPKADESKQPAPKEEIQEAPAPESAPRDAGKADDAAAKKNGPVDDSKDDKDEEEQK